MQITTGIIDQMAAVAAQTVNPDAIVLFGSYATGNARLDSDVDLLIVESPPFDRRKEMVKIWSSLASFPVPKDILVYSSDEIKQFSNMHNHVVSQALREGRFLYGSIR